ncbi:pilus assembly protein TadG-related protein [Orrella marina]|nr:pilus assembly protein TadG-related protein [Orrella marina]
MGKSSEGGCAADRSESGTILVIVAIVMVSLLGFAGLAIDFGYYFVQKTRLQALADSAALACGYSGCESTTESSDPNAQLFSGINSQGIPLRVIVLDGAADPNDECPEDEGICFRVRASKTWDTFFIRLFNIPEMTAWAEATATGGSVEEKMIVPAMLALGGDITFTQGSKATITVVGDVLSSGTVTGAGGIDMQGESQVKSNYSIQDPCSALQAQVPPQQTFDSCDFNNFTLSTESQCTASMLPGTYCGTTRVEVTNGCKVEMSTGNYFFEDDWEITESPNGNGVDGTAGVFIYHKSGSLITSNSKGNVQFSPYESPPSGQQDYSGVVYWNDSGEPLTFYAHRQGIDLFLNGIVYAPGSDIIIDNSETNNAKDTFGFASIIGNSIDVDMTSGELQLGPRL